MPRAFVPTKSSWRCGVDLVCCTTLLAAHYTSLSPPPSLQPPPCARFHSSPHRWTLTESRDSDLCFCLVLMSRFEVALAVLHSCSLLAVEGNRVLRTIFAYYQRRIYTRFSISQSQLSPFLQFSMSAYCTFSVTVPASEVAVARLLNSRQDLLDVRRHSSNTEVMRRVMLLRDTYESGAPR